MILDAICSVIDFLTCGKLLAKKLPVEEALAADHAESNEGRSLAALEQKSSESIPMPDSERKEPIHPPQPTHVSSADMRG